jgi:hypothetical protein
MSIFEAFNDISVAGFTKGIYAVLPLLGLLLLYNYNILRKFVVVIVILLRKLFIRCFGNRNQLAVDRIISVDAVELEPAAVRNLFPKNASVFLVQENV